VDQDRLSFACWPTYTPTEVTGMADSQWHHIAVTHDGSVQKMYENGELVASVSSPGSMNINSNPVIIGSLSGTDRYFNGRLDDVRIYNRVLLLPAIQALAGISPLCCDIYVDGIMNFKDLRVLADEWLSSGIDADLYVDNNVDFKDYAELANAMMGIE